MKTEILETSSNVIDNSIVQLEGNSISKIEMNQIYSMDCVKGMKLIPDNQIDLVVTSPPYDAIRNYNGFDFDMHATGEQIYRVLKEGGICAVVMQDQTKNFGKSLTTFRTIVDWCDSFGFKLFECVIYRKHGPEGAWWSKRFRMDHEYMPIFLKGVRPQYFNKETLKVASKHAGKVMTGSGSRRTDGSTNPLVTRPINEKKCRGSIWDYRENYLKEIEDDVDECGGTVWDYLMAGDKDPLKRKHPAPFPDKIPTDFISCFCPPGGIVLDPFAGSGSTCVAAKKLDRKYIGFDVSEEYCELARKRVKSVLEPMQSLFK